MQAEFASISHPFHILFFSLVYLFLLPQHRTNIKNLPVSQASRHHLSCQLLQIKVYEARHPLALECSSLQEQLETLTHQLHTKEEETAFFRKVK